MYLKGAQIDPHNILTEWKGREGKFVRTFGINDTRNNNEWRSTWQGIKDNISKALGRPGIEYETCNEAGCGLDHVEAESFEENLEKQKPFEVTSIIDYVIDDDTHSVDFIHEVNSNDFWEKLQKGIIKYVSPMIWPNNGGAESKGTGRADLPIIDAWDYEWVHSAFLEKDPAFGDIANVKTICEGKNCGVQLLTAKSLCAKDGSSCGNCKFFIESGKCKLVNGKIKKEDICNLYTFGKINQKDIPTNPKYSKEEVDYKHALSATLADPSTTTLTPLKEIPLLVKHKKKLHLLSASSCVTEKIKHLADSRPEMDSDQRIAVAFSECGESGSLKSSYTVCSCDSKLEMADSEQQLVELKSKYKAQGDEKKELEAKLKAQEDKEEKSDKAKHARYAKLFATTANEDEEKKMMATLKATEDEEDMKTAKEEYENHKMSRKAQSEDPEKKELMKSNKAMMATLAEPMISGLVALRRGKLDESELTTYETALKAKSFTEIQSLHDNEKYLMTQPDSLFAKTESNLAFPGEQNSHALSAKSIDDILEATP